MEDTSPGGLMISVLRGIEIVFTNVHKRPQMGFLN